MLFCIGGDSAESGVSTDVVCCATGTTGGWNGGMTGGDSAGVGILGGLVGGGGGGGAGGGEGGGTNKCKSGFLHQEQARHSHLTQCDDAASR